MDVRMIGKNGEDRACKYLVKHGYEIIDRNYRTRFGEIDIIVQNGEYIVFAEVKTRSVGAPARPAEQVDGIKQGKIIRTAQLYLASNPSELQPRFDVIEIIMKDQKVMEVNHIIDAFGVV